MRYCNKLIVMMGYRIGSLILFFLFLFALHKSSSAQFMVAVLGVDGLTCSACSFGTEKSIRKLDFVQDVKMDLNKNIATISFKKDKEVLIDALVKKVYDAGFSVRFVEAVYHFNAPVAIDKNIFQTKTSSFFVLKTSTSSLSGDVRMRFISEKYIPKKEFSQWKSAVLNAREQTKAMSNPVYFVSIP